MTIPIARYAFSVHFDKPAKLPFYTGSMLRGAFGHALRKLSCITRLDNCQTCPLYHSCPYPKIFEPPPPSTHALQKFSQIPAPYVIEPPPPGALGGRLHEDLMFHMVLMGPAISEVPLIVAAWQRALRFGLGASRLTGWLVAVDGLDPAGHRQRLFEQDQEELTHTELRQPRMDRPMGDALSLHVQTPLRIQRQSKPLGVRELSARDFLVTLARRHALLSDFYGSQPHELDMPALAAAAETVTLQPTALHWCDWERYSHRQGQKMALGGVMGKLTLTGKLAPFAASLHLGQWLHLGKNATFGMGHYTLEDIS